MQVVWEFIDIIGNGVIQLLITCESRKAFCQCYKKKMCCSILDLWHTILSIFKEIIRMPEFMKMLFFQLVFAIEVIFLCTCCHLQIIVKFLLHMCPYCWTRKSTLWLNKHEQHHHPLEPSCHPEIAKCTLWWQGSFSYQLIGS